MIFLAICLFRYLNGCHTCAHIVVLKRFQKWSKYLNAPTLAIVVVHTAERFSKEKMKKFKTREMFSFLKQK